MITASEVVRTIDMFDHQHLDVRTVTLGIDLSSCAHPDPKAAADRIYDKIVRTAERLPAVCRDISGEFGVPIINRRISVTPISQVAAASDTAYSSIPPSLRDKLRASVVKNMLLSLVVK